MEIITSYYTDKGKVKQVNQDSLMVKVVHSPKGKIAFAVICDGMGGLEQGEVASKEVIIAFQEWFQSSFAKAVANDTVSEEEIFRDWTNEIENVSDRLKQYADQQGIMLGTTVSVLLLYQRQYYICHVGDSRIYQVKDDLIQLTEDHTLVAQEVKMGGMTAEEAKHDARRNVLLQCVGAGDVIDPQFEVGNITENVTFVLCSDGFVHEITEEELCRYFQPDILVCKQYVTDVCENLSQLAMERGERDNVTAIGVVVRIDGE